MGCVSNWEALFCFLSSALQKNLTNFYSQKCVLCVSFRCFVLNIILALSCSIQAMRVWDSLNRELCLSEVIIVIPFRNQSISKLPFTMSMRKYVSMIQSCSLLSLYWRGQCNIILLNGFSILRCFRPLMLPQVILRNKTVFTKTTSVKCSNIQWVFS